MIQPVSVPIDEKFITDACYYAFKTVTCSFDNAMKPRFGNGGLFKHLLGKLGETAFFRFCLENQIAVKHTPFRNDYSELDENDDFIISLLGHDFRVEVKTATLNSPLNPDGKLVLFYNRDQYKAQQDHSYLVVFAAVNKEVTQIALIGWIHAEDIRSCKIWTKNMKAPAYAIPLAKLRDMRKLADAEVWG
ncbi:hypothetical protein [Geoglobus ahangari]